MELRIILIVASIVYNCIAAPAASAQTLARLDAANLHDAEYLAKRQATGRTFEDGNSHTKQIGSGKYLLIRIIRYRCARSRDRKCIQR